jgi:MFS family permease
MTPVALTGDDSPGSMGRVRLLSAHAAMHFGLIRVGREHHTPWYVLRGKGAFRWYFAGSVVSDFGSWLQNTVQVLLAYQLTHSVLGVGLVTFAQFSSPLLLGPWAGVLADRFGGRSTLLATQVTAGAAAAGLAGLDFAGVLNEWTLVAGTVIGGLAFTFALPARNITVQRLVPPGRLKLAFAMDSVSYNLGRASAPVLAVAVGAAGSGFAWAFAGNAVSFAVFSVVLARARLHRAVQPERRSRVRDGFLVARRDGCIMVLLLMVAAVTIADDPVLVLGPALARQLHAAPAWSGWFIAALGAGTVLGSFQRSKRHPTLRLAATALAALALCMLVFVFAPSTWVAAAAALGAGASCLVANSVTRTILAKRAGPANATAVMAVWAIAWAGSKPFASLLDGVLGSAIGPQWTGLVLAAPALVPAVVLMLLPGLGVRLTSQRPERGARQSAGGADGGAAEHRVAVVQDGGLAGGDAAGGGTQLDPQLASLERGRAGIYLAVGPELNRALHGR